MHEDYKMVPIHFMAPPWIREALRAESVRQTGAAGRVVPIGEIARGIFIEALKAYKPAVTE